MTTAKPLDPFEDNPFGKPLAFLLPQPSSPAEQRVREAYVDAIRAVRNEIEHGRHVDRATTLRIASDILGALAEHAAAVPALYHCPRTAVRR